MRVESSLVDHQKGQKDLCELKNERSDGDAGDKGNKKNRRRDKKPMTMTTTTEPSVVQKLYNTCRKVFARGGAGFIPSPRDVQRLQLVLDSLKPHDVGLTPEMSYFEAPENGGVPPITYLHLYECNKFSIGIFCLPPSGVIPLHNHPEMTVFSKILFGSMHIKSYDWETGATGDANSENLDQPKAQPPGTRLAKIEMDTVFTAPCKTSILFPASGGNMHCFTAVTSCAVLDVLGPPYSDPQGRHCTYYKEFPYCSASPSSSGKEGKT